MKRKFILLVLLFFSVLLFSACKKNYEGPEKTNPDQNDQETQSLNNFNNRKIYYTASAWLMVDDINKSVKNIKSFLNADEWFESENQYTNTSYLVVRIKSERIDSFIDHLSNLGSVSNLSKSATDVSLDFYDIEAKIETLEAQKVRLLKLYQEANIYDMISISSRISEVDLELNRLKSTQNNYNSRVEYSTITLTIKTEASEDTRSYGKRIVDSFLGGSNAVLTIFEYLIIIFAALLPFMILVTPIVITVIIFNKRKKKKSRNYHM